MSNENGKLYFFPILIGDPFAKYGVVKIKESNNSVDDEVVALQTGKAIDWRAWSGPSKDGLASELDIAFDEAGQVTLIFQIAEPHVHTVFADQQPIENHRLRGFKSAPIIKNAKAYDYNGYTTWASCELNLTDVRNKVKADQSNSISDGKMIKKFPFRFNFFETSTKVSPVVLPLTHIPFVADPEDASLLTDGRIHPRSASNLISLND